MADNTGAVDLSSLSDEEKRAVEEMADAHKGSYSGDQNPDENKRKVLTGFTVLLNYDGDPEVVSLPEDYEVLLQSEPTADLIYMACGNVMKDITLQMTSMATAQNTAMIMQQQARAMMEQQQNAMLQAQVSKGLRHG